MLESITSPSLLEIIKAEQAQFLASVLPLSADEVLAQIERPKNPEHGHLAFPCFALAKKQKTSPKELASSFSESLKKTRNPAWEQVQALSGFINFTFCPHFLIEQACRLFSQPELASFKKMKEHLIVDFASPNVAKHMNAGHLRASVLGQAIVNLSRALGFRVTALNHLGDWGTQFGKLLWAYKKWSQDQDLESQNLESLVSLYVRFHEEAENDPTKQEEARQLFKKLEQGDKQLLALWKTFINISLKDYEYYWKLLNIKHDKVIGESFYKDKVDDVKKRLKSLDLLKESKGAQVVFIDDNKPPCMITKTDGASTYAARDLASIIYRFEQLKADKNIYVTGSDQKLHFQQIFHTLARMNFPNSKSCLHIPFGMYLFKDSSQKKVRMQTRKGHAVYLKDIIETARSKVKDIIEERRPQLKDKKTIIDQVAIGAIVFNDLSSDASKDVEFNWNRILDFEGDTGPFVQYTHVRCLSLLKKYKKSPPSSLSQLQTKEELALIWTLLCFDEAVSRAFKDFKPHILAEYLLELSRQFNRFYASHPILDSSKKEDKIFLVEGVRRVLNRGLSLLNVPTPSQM